MSEPLFGCSNDECASEASYRPSNLRVYEGEPWCQYCWDDRDPVFITFDDEGDGDEWLKWHDLPPFVPEFQREIDALKQRVRELEATQRWRDLRTDQPGVRQDVVVRDGERVFVSQLKHMRACLTKYPTKRYEWYPLPPEAGR